MAPNNTSKTRKPSKVVKPKQSSKRTISTRNTHRFQSFSERIAKLKIDPIRRRRRAEDEEELRDPTETYFGRSLEQWRDLNLSHTFASFVKEISPLCDSLPSVLYNEEKIMETLVSYIDKGDALALEPLLSLLSHFAHDLDSRFEKHFHRAVTTITALAARHSDPAVVEWCFTCLAWLFKFLSRLLTPDLRPLYKVMATYLGRQNQKPFIIRFAAESLSFLIRKAAMLYERDPTPLDSILGHTLQDYHQVANTASADLYRQGITTLLTESMKGLQGDLHSSAPFILKSALGVISQIDDNTHTLVEVVVGALTSLIHHVYAQKFAPLLNTILEFVEFSSQPQSSRDILFISRLLFTIATVRKGGSVEDWTPLVQTIRTLVIAHQSSPDLTDIARKSLLSATAAVMQSATIDAVLPELSIIEVLRSGAWTPYFLQFCDLYSRLGRERFNDFLLPQFKKFAIEQATGNEDPIFRLLPGFMTAARDAKLKSTDALQKEIVKRLRRVADAKKHEVPLELLASANLALDALPFIHGKAHACPKLESTLLDLVTRSVSAEGEGRDAVDDFAVGKCLECLLGITDRTTDLSEIWIALCTQSHRYQGLERFWSNLLKLLQLQSSSPILIQQHQMDELHDPLLRCLSSSNHNVRTAALDIIRLVYVHRKILVPSLLDVAISIESTPITLDTIRHISMNIRSLALRYSETQSDSLLREAIPTYCFGLLHIQLSQAWEDACNSLAHIANTSVAEDVITKITQEWIQGQASERTTVEANLLLDIESAGFHVISDFECPNSAKLSAICEQTFDESDGGRPSVLQHFQSDHLRVEKVTSNAREQALRVLSKVPRLAEKHSRMLVPILLRWAGTTEIAAEDDNSELSSHRWTRKDQKAMLGIFAQFTNPKMLYKTADVYSALLHLCANGDIEIQRSALKAIFAWKDSAVIRYEENLTTLLDEVRFREVLSVFLQDAEQNDATMIRAEDQAALMPVLLRLLYGRAVAGGKHGQDSRRKAIFVALSRYDHTVLEGFLDIALGPVAQLKSLCGHNISEASIKGLQMAPRQQLGMVNMLSDMLGTLGPALESFCIKMFHTVLLCTVGASRQLEVGNGTAHEPTDASLLRAIRQNGIQCLAIIFSIMQDSEIGTYACVTFEELIRPRLSKFATENTQSVSGMMRLISTWATIPGTKACLLALDGEIMNAVASLLREPASKDEVRLFVLQEILNQLLDTETRTLLDATHINTFARSIGDAIMKNPSKPVLDACVASLTLLAGHVRDSAVADTIINVSAELLTRPSKIVSPRTKTGLLKTILPLLDHAESASESQLYDAVCGLYSRLGVASSRVLLSEVLVRLSRSEREMTHAAGICRDLNSLRGISEEPDHDKREQGFSRIYEHYESFSGKQWLPLVHNCLFFIRDDEDLVNRTSASRALEKFIAIASSNTDSLKAIVSDVLLPGIVYGMNNPSELVRTEYLRLLGHLVEGLPDLAAVKDLRTLTHNADDEASFFTNVLHIQQHRRLRALRRLSDEAVNISSSNVTQVFVPLLEHFVFDQAEGDSGRTLADQSVLTLGALARALNWSAIRASFKRYIRYLKSEDKDEKIVLRLLGVFVDAIESVVRNLEKTISLEEHAKKTEAIANEFLPPLAAYLHHKDESTIDRRMPIAISTVRLLLLLPEPETASRLPPVLTDVCQVLKSRSQEARDQARKALTDILALVGPSYLSFILKELRSALQRGYQLHVLSFTVHSMLVNVIKSYQPGELDDCLSELVSIVMDDIFGVTGQEKDAEEYKSGMKEVKSSKSFDTMELLASVTSVQKIGRLIQPLQALLSERLDSKSTKKIEDLLHRVRKGIDHHPEAGSRDMLSLCHEIIRHVHSDKPTTKLPDRGLDKKLNRYLIQAEPDNQKKIRSGATSQAFKLVSFALDLLRKVLRRHEDLMTPTNLAGFLPIIGDAIVQGEEDVKLSALKLLGTIMKVPMPELEANAPVYVKEAVRIIKGAPSMTAESARAGLDVITAVLREKRTAEVAERDIADMLKALKNDLDEPDRQGIVYKFLRAVLGRKIMIAEVYEIMDEVGKVMVTNADQSVREGARSVYLQFVLEYPQGKDRLNKQSEFLVENLKYKHAAGRQSVMELLSQLLSKLPEDVFKQLAFTLFVALVPVQVGDVDPSCQQMAGLLIHKIFGRADEESMIVFLGLLNKWLANGANAGIQTAALRCWTTLLKARVPSTKHLQGFRNGLNTILDADEIVESANEINQTGEALQAFEVLIDVAPQIAFAKESSGIWQALIALLAQPDSPLSARETAARLLGKDFAHLASASSKIGVGLSALPLQGAFSLEMGADQMRQICDSSLRTLRLPFDLSSEELRNYTVRNLVFLGRCFAANDMRRKEEIQSDSDEDVEDESTANRDPSALAYLFNRLSYIIRQENLPIESRTSAVQCQGSLANVVDTLPNLESLLRPLYSLTDASIPRSSDDATKNLVDKARELLDVVQKKVGPEEYIRALGIVRSEAKGRREERRQKRRIDAVSAPERWAKEKRKKHDDRKAKLKSRALEARGKRRAW